MLTPKLNKTLSLNNNNNEFANKLDLSKLVPIESLQTKDNLIKGKVIKIIYIQGGIYLILMDDSQNRNEILALLLFNSPQKFDTDKIYTGGTYYIKNFKLSTKSNQIVIHPYLLKCYDSTQFIHCEQPFNAIPHYRFTSLLSLHTDFIYFHSIKLLYIDVIGYIESIEPIKEVKTISDTTIDMLSFMITDSSNTSISVVAFGSNIKSVSSLQQGDIISIKHARISHNYHSLLLSDYSYFELNAEHLNEYKELRQFITQKQQHQHHQHLQSNLLISKSLFSGDLIMYSELDKLPDGRETLPECNDEQTYRSIKDNMYILRDVSFEIIDSATSNRYGCPKCYFIFKDDSLCTRCNLPSNILYDLNFMVKLLAQNYKVIVRDSVADKIMWPTPAFKFYQQPIPNFYYESFVKTVGLKIVDIFEELSIDVNNDSIHSSKKRSRYAWELVYSNNI